MKVGKQNRTHSGLSAKQIKAAEMLANPELDSNRSAIIKKVGVSRSTFYDWLKDTTFTSYVCELIDAYTDADYSAVWKALIERCKRGDVQAIKLYFELKGKYVITEP